ADSRSAGPVSVGARGRWVVSDRLRLRRVLVSQLRSARAGRARVSRFAGARTGRRICRARPGADRRDPPRLVRGGSVGIEGAVAQSASGRRAPHARTPAGTAAPLAGCLRGVPTVAEARAARAFAASPADRGAPAPESTRG